jgi:hypothetical protein
MFTTARVATSVELIEKQGHAIYATTELGKGTELIEKYLYSICIDWINEKKGEERLAARLDRDPLVDHDTTQGNIAQCNFAFLQVAGYVSPVSCCSIHIQSKINFLLQ